MTKNQQMAYVRALYEMANADGRVERSESTIITKLLEVWGFSTDDLRRSLAIDIVSAAQTLRVLPNSDKIQLGKHLGQIASADGRLDAMENKFFAWLDSQVGMSKCAGFC